MMMRHNPLPNFPNLPGYTIIEQLYVSFNTVVYRAVKTVERVNVIIKLLRQEYPSPSKLVQFQNHYTITKNLNIPGIVKPLSTEIWQNGYVLVMEDCDSISVQKYCQKQAFLLPQILKIGIQLADILHEIGRCGIVHKDIKPANILIHLETGQVKLIDFCIASVLPTEHQAIHPPDRLEGTLAYLAPEQTGRMNRGIDYRTDFYGLGVTIYELLTGELPFRSIDPLELIYCHLAKLPLSPDRVNQQIPAMVAEIVLKLMAKNAENRYQTALGLKYDLEQCLEQWEAAETITEFKLGQHDISDRFLISEQLYGREANVRQLLTAFDRVSAGSVEMLLVAGCSGIGKTVVVNEIHQPIIRQRGYFIKGKFDQFNRNLPLSAFVQALRDLIGQLLGESDAQLDRWKQKILAAVGENGQVLIAVIPELEQIIGAQPPLPELSGTAAEQRFNLIFQEFVGVFTTLGHPLTIFLDDLQWADSASLKLLPVLMKPGGGYLLIVGAYRDNEVSPAHPLIMTVRDLEKTGAKIETICLQPLLNSDINRLIADTLNCDRSLAQPLTNLVYQKTQGNPFFTTQFLKSLYRDGSIEFNYSQGIWQCDINQIEIQSLTEDVVEFMAGQLQRLPLATQHVLKLAACIGGQFDLHTLAIVCERSIADTASDLWGALKDGSIVPLDRIYKFFQAGSGVTSDNPFALALPDSSRCTYRFLHDRVQQAAYSLIPTTTTATIHLHIGRLLLASTPERDLDLHLFQIVNQLNCGIPLIQTTPEREQLAQLNRQAGEKARRSAAYDAAMNYLNTGLQLLSPQAWQNDRYPLCLSLHHLAAEVAYLTGNYARSHQLIQTGLQNTTIQLDRAKFYEIQILTSIAQNLARDAVAYAQKVLPNFGMRLPQQPSPVRMAIGFLITVVRMAGKKPQDLLTLPPMTDPDKLAGCQLLNAVGAAATTSMPEMLPFITFEGIATYLRSGNIPTAAMGYTIYAYLICEHLGWVDTGYEIGRAAIELCHQTGSKTALAKTLVIWNHFISYRKESLRATLPLLLEAYQAALEVGDVEYAAYSLSAYLDRSYWIGRNLAELQREAIAYRPALLELQQQLMTAIHAIDCQGIENLTTVTADPCLLVGSFFDETALSERDRSKVENVINLRKLQLAVIFQNYPLGLAQIALIEKDLKYLESTFLRPIFYFYQAVVRLSQYRSLTRHQQKATLTKINTARQQLAKLATSAPVNYQHQLLLIDAERLRIRGKSIHAIPLYERAIAAAKTNGYLHEEAIANELAARFYIEFGQPKIAQTYIIEAYYNYIRWGATTKVTDLENRYPQLLSPVLAQSQDLSVDDTSSQTVSDRHQDLDLTTLLNASQAISQEIELDRLLATLLNTIVTNAGADKCVFLLQTARELEIVALVTAGQQPQILTSPIALATSADVAISLVNRVKRSLEPIAIVNARSDVRLAGDLYLERYNPQSILCSPILKQGKLLGILYLENNLTMDAFTRDRLEVIDFLSAQIAISLEHAQLYQALQQNEHKFREFVENVHDLIFALAPTGNFSYISPQFKDLLGYEVEQFLARSFAPLTHPEDMPRVVASNQQLLTTGLKQTGLEFRVKHRAGHWVWLTCNNTPIYNERGQIIGLRGIARDISDRKQAELQLQQTNAELLRSSRLKDEFLANMSHEFRTPLNAILGMNEALQGEVFGTITERQLKALKTIERSGSHLLELINDILDLAKTESGEMTLDCQPTAVRLLCNSSSIFVKQQALVKRIAITTNIPPNLPKLLVDERRIRQVLINLLNNAVKFTPEGGQITLSVNWQQQLDPDVGGAIPHNYLQITVADTGIGIAPADLDRLFQPFVQIDSTLNRKYPGTGLGLALVKKIVELHGGRVSLTSELGVGSCFAIELPCITTDLTITEIVDLSNPASAINS